MDGLLPPVGQLRGEGNSRKQTPFSLIVCLCLCVYFFFPMQHFRRDASTGGHEGDDDGNKKMKMSVPTRDMFVCHALSMEHFIHPLHDLMCTLTLSPFYR